MAGAAAPRAGSADTLGAAGIALMVGGAGMLAELRAGSAGSAAEDVDAADGRDGSADGLDVLGTLAAAGSSADGSAEGADGVGSADVDDDVCDPGSTSPARLLNGPALLVAGSTGAEVEDGAAAVGSGRAEGAATVDVGTLAGAVIEDVGASLGSCGAPSTVGAEN